MALEFMWKPENDSADDPVRFRTTRWSAILRQEIGRTVPAPADIEQEIHRLCDVLVAAEGGL